MNVMGVLSCLLCDDHCSHNFMEDCGPILGLPNDLSIGKKT